MPRVVERNRIVFVVAIVLVSLATALCAPALFPAVADVNSHSVQLNDGNGKALFTVMAWVKNESTISWTGLDLSGEFANHTMFSAVGCRVPAGLVPADGSNSSTGILSLAPPPGPGYALLIYRVLPQDCQLVLTGK